jgi:hypothetical protein
MSHHVKLPEKVKEISSRLAGMVAKEPGFSGFEAWASAFIVTAASMAQFVGTPKAEFMAGVSSNWDAIEGAGERVTQ